MLDINLIRTNPDLVREGISLKKANPRLVDDFLVLDKKWRELVNETDNLRAEQKRASESREIEKAKALKDEIQSSEGELKQIEIKRNEILRQLPNLPLDDVPAGKDESENVILREVGEKPKFDFKPKDYLELGEKLGLIDIERASKVSGSRFGYLKNQAALLEFALVQFAFERLVKYGFIPVVPPVMIKEEMMEAMGYIDSEKDKEERYFFEKDRMYFVGTSEQSIGPMHSDEFFQENELPKRYVGFSTCFRREAGSYGKDTKGILRVHQFDKVEMFSFCHPEKSKEEHNLLIKIEEELMRDLKLPYRLVHLCTGDISVPSAATFDIETWMPGQNQYRETHSSSNCTDFQARRLNIRYKPASKFVHTLNGTVFAIGRILIAILENYQQKDGSILVPEVLRPHIRFDKISPFSNTVNN
jgi:seryl-tRNA synthetase